MVNPLFDMTDDTKLKRAGLDYHDLAHVRTHDHLDQALACIPGRTWAFTGHANTYHTDVAYADGDALLFGPEPTGLPQEVLDDARLAGLLRIPMMPGVRSLNLANSASIGLYEAWRQLSFSGGV